MRHVFIDFNKICSKIEAVCLNFRPNKWKSRQNASFFICLNKIEAECLNFHLFKRNWGRMPQFSFNLSWNRWKSASICFGPGTGFLYGLRDYQLKPLSHSMTGSYLADRRRTLSYHQRRIRVAFVCLRQWWLERNRSISKDSFWRLTENAFTQK